MNWVGIDFGLLEVIGHGGLGSGSGLVYHLKLYLYPGIMMVECYHC